MACSDLLQYGSDSSDPRGLGNPGGKGVGTMSPFEVIMLICFGSAWPFSIAKAVRTKQVSGKSPLFMAIICLGYLSGIFHKALHASDWVIVLYALNMVLIAIDLSLYFYYKPSRHSG